jgi:hypothetical protein
VERAISLLSWLSMHWAAFLFMRGRFLWISSGGQKIRSRLLVPNIGALYRAHFGMSDVESTDGTRATPVRRNKRHAAGRQDITTTPPGLGRLLSERELLLGDKPIIYHELVTAVTRDLQPKDVIDSMYVSDIVEAIYESWRLRNMKVGIVEHGRKEAARQLLREARDPTPSAQFECSRREFALVENWWRGDLDSKIEIDRIAGGKEGQDNPLMVAPFRSSSMSLSESTA